jgi:hypothetical protein
VDAALAYVPPWVHQRYELALNSPIRLHNNCSHFDHTIVPKRKQSRRLDIDYSNWTGAQ